MTSKSGCLKWEEIGRVGIIQISNKSSNLLPNPDFAEENDVKEWIEQSNIRGVIIKGEGRHFSAGADLNFFEGIDINLDNWRDKFKVGRGLLRYIDELEKPVIASIDGVCAGGGLEIALACHIRYCSKKSIFGFPEINHGIMPGFDGVKRLVDIAGRGAALEMLLVGEIFDAEHALETGIINGITDENNSFEFVLNVMNKIISRNERPVQYAIRAVNNSSKMAFDEAAEEEARLFTDLVVSKYGGVNTI